MHSASFRQRFFAGFFALASLSMIDAPVEAQDIENYLPKGEIIHGRIMELAAPRDIQVLSQKLQAAVQNDQTWFQQYITENENQRPLPYHPRLGLTELEYRRVLELAGTMELRESGTVDLTVKRLKNGGFELVSSDHEMPLNGLRVYPNENLVETSYGILGEFSEINQQDPGSATGRWTGAQWKRSERTDVKLTAVKLAIGKRTDHGDGIIYYDVKNLSADTTENFSVILLYPLE